MADNEIRIAKHNVFYQIFFRKHKEIIEKFILLDFNNVNLIFKHLTIFESSYSYYIESNDDTLLQDTILGKKGFESNENYHVTLNKLNKLGLRSLSYTELINLNELYFECLTETLVLFERCCYAITPDDIMPRASDMSNSDLGTGWVVYDVFFESLFNLHSLIAEKLYSFNITEFKDITQTIMSYYYGYSYYLSAKARLEIKNELREMYSIYNNKEFYIAYFNLLQSKASDKEILFLQIKKEEIFQKANLIFKLINEDLPKKKLFPKKKERVMVDRTLI